MTLPAVSLADLLPSVPTGNLLLLPQVARAALFAAHEGPAILLTTAERLRYYTQIASLGCAVSVNPDLHAWSTKHDHVVLDVKTALELFPQNPEEHLLTLQVGKSYPREDLMNRLEKLGYVRGTDFEFRGDTLEFDVKHEAPNGATGARNNTTKSAQIASLRAEFFGDELDTLRQFQVSDQDVSSADEPMQGQKIDSFVLAPTSDYLSDSKWESTILEQLSGRVFLDAPEFYPSTLGTPTVTLQTTAATTSTQQTTTQVTATTQLDALWAKLATREVTSFGRAPLDLPDLKSDLQNLSFYRARLSELENDIVDWLKADYRVMIFVRHDRTASYLADKLLKTKRVPWLKTPTIEGGQLGFVRMSAEGGFVIPEHRTVIITEDLIYGFQGGSSLRGQRLAGRPVTDALGLHVGDFLIHPEHGIGQFEGLETRTVLGVTRDYLNIAYRGGAKLSVPIEQLPVLRRHPGTTDDPPQLSSFDKKDWSRAKEKARRNAEEVASKLLVQYAARQVTPGHSFPAQPEWDQQIEHNFQFKLTPDQARALKETMQDLEKPNPADRLISGDVGFGKTEVALRAAHRIVGHGKQVALLVPTTLLAEQHSTTFMERFRGTPVRVESLSRFTTDKQARGILAGLRDGQVDIVIGTHRLLSKDIKFKDLGLIIVDEEHRFGVSQKEKLRAMRGLPSIENGKLDLPDGVKAIDTLALSATPIPRTLYMSMVGLRDMSSIQTPPEGRKPIETILAPFDPVTVRDAIVKEIERGGKVFYIHDRVASIAERSIYLQALVPEARIGVAHGRMNEEELEEIMLGFEEGAFDVLLSTTIVETGLDIPEANTILIERADRLGLAQLYQLRGRVGRRSQNAHAYLFYPPHMTENAQRRLWAIADLQDLGSGHLLAEKDMEIRGVGNILGEEQHGHVQAVSIDVYTEMLAEAIAKLKGEPLKTVASVALDLPINARLTPEYFEYDEEARIATYGRLSEARTIQAISRIERDLRKKYGPPSPDVQNFIDIAKLRLVAVAKRVASISQSMTHLNISFAYKDQDLDYDAMQLRTYPYPTEVQQRPPSVRIDRRGIKTDDYARLLIELLNYFA